MKALRIGNGLEFVLEQFNEFCRKLGIKRHKTIAGTPQQNGLNERMNRSILERVSCMLLGVGLPRSFWGEAANTIVYMINKYPLSSLDSKTPMEVWRWKSINSSNLRVFVLWHLHM